MPAKQLVLVTGAGRSGTSAVAGTLHMLGFHVPRPVLRVNATNPKGFFESRWPVRFHRGLMDRAVIEQTDGRPVAARLVADQVDEPAREALRTWLRTQFEHAEDVVVKDPRAAWVPALWADEAAALGGRTGFVTMLRAPAEVVRSRQSHYHQNRPHMDEYGFGVMNLAGWVNANLTVERLTRGRSRSVLRYDDLRSDWRSAMRVVRDDLGLRLNHPLTDEPHAEVDAFVEPELNRHVGTWDGLDLPDELVTIADGVHEQLSLLADRHGDDEAVCAAMDRWSEQYAALYRRSQAIAVDATTAEARAARRRGRTEGRTEAERAALERSWPARARRLGDRVGRRVRRS